MMRKRRTKQRAENSNNKYLRGVSDLQSLRSPKNRFETIFLLLHHPHECRFRTWWNLRRRQFWWVPSCCEYFHIQKPFLHRVLRNSKWDKRRRLVVHLVEFFREQHSESAAAVVLLFQDLMMMMMKIKMTKRNSELTWRYRKRRWRREYHNTKSWVTKEKLPFKKVTENKTWKIDL